MGIVLVTAAVQLGGIADREKLLTDLNRLAAGTSGRVGICVLEERGGEALCVQGDERFQLQSVMKLVVSAAVFDAVDGRRLRLDDVITVRPEDASPGPQDFANIVRERGSYQATVEQLVARSIIDSDSTSIDVLIEKLGGIVAVQEFLRRKAIEGISVDRDERRLQSESVGLGWRPEYAADDVFERAVAALPEAARDRAARDYLADTRDTATPLGMARFLRALTAGALLAPDSTEKLIAIMGRTATGVDRLKAGLPAGWALAHKTGTGRTWKGIVSATNDVGIVTAPDGGKIAVAVFINGASSAPADQAAIIAGVSRLVAGAYLPATGSERSAPAGAR